MARAWQIYRAYFGVMAGYASWLLLPYAGVVLLNLVGDQAWTKFSMSLLLLAQAVLFLGMLTIFPLLAACAVRRGNVDLSPQKLSEEAWKLAPSIVWVGLLETAIIFGGLVLLVIPAFVFSVWFGFGQLAVVLDGKKGMAALAFSREMVRGQFWAVAWRAIGGPILIVLIYAVALNVVVGGIAAIGNVPPEAFATFPPPLWADVITTVAEIFLLPFLFIYVTLVYLELRPKVMPDSEEKAPVEPPEPISTPA